MSPSSERRSAQRRIGFLSTDDLEGFFVYDTLCLEPLADRGVDVETVSWRDPVADWDRYEAVVIRSTWDYQKSPDEFLETLEAIDRSRAMLINPLELVRWNLDKRYLGELRQRGVRIVPTSFESRISATIVRGHFDRFGTDELVLKPVISANADDTFRVRRNDPQTTSAALRVLGNRRILVQPFMPNVVHEGEYSLFFFGHDYSHAILKTPDPADFRAQEEHGASLASVEVNPLLLARGTQAISALPMPALYARIDLVRTFDDDFALMEAELIEPSLYFQFDDTAATRFADALIQWLGPSP
jgi:glutathione synthase/RimK-type ligase-like ATP-grasp enzyme